MSEKIWTPKEIKQKDVVVFEAPIIRQPITNRMIRYFIPSLILSLIIFFSLGSIKSILMPLSTFCLMFPFLATLVLNSPRDGKYIEDIIKTKYKYRTKSAVILNEKAMRAREE